MSAIAWWVIPLVATFAAIAYATWRGKPRAPEDTHEAMEARERFRRAIEGDADSRRRARASERSSRPVGGAAEDPDGDSPAEPRA